MIIESDILKNGFKQTHRTGKFESEETIQINGERFPRFVITVRKVVGKQYHSLVVSEILEFLGKPKEKLRFSGWVDSPVVLHYIIRAIDFNKAPNK